MTTHTSIPMDSPVKTTAMLTLYKRLNGLPAGKWLFSKILCLKSPYFQSIAPKVIRLEPGFSEWTLRKRRKVTNHIGSVHALAMGNLAEMCAGTCIEATLPLHLRWIPKRTTVDYLAKATTNLRGVCQINQGQLVLGDNVVTVIVFDENKTEVFHAEITMYVSQHKKTN